MEPEGEDIDFIGKKFVVFAQANKFVDKFSMAIPIEVTPFGRIFVMRELEKIGGLPRMRMLDKGYPFVTRMAI